jgi:hypothetical protein
MQTHIRISMQIDSVRPCFSHTSKHVPELIDLMYVHVRTCVVSIMVITLMMDFKISFYVNSYY